MSVKAEPDRATDQLARVPKDRVREGVGKLWIGSTKRLPVHGDEQGAAWVVELSANMAGKRDRLLLFTESQSNYYRMIRKGPVS